MLRQGSRNWAGLLCAGWLSAAGAARAVDPVGLVSRADTSQKGSLLFYPHVELKWDAAGQVRQDTFIELSNDFPDAVQVQLYFINGDAPTDPVLGPDGITVIERGHPGWNWVDIQIPLTANEPTYWSMLTGLPKGVSSFTILDPGNPLGRPDPDPDNAGGRVIRGFCIGWAVDASGKEIRWNHLSGQATVIDYARSAAWEYGAWGFQSRGVDHGQQPASCLVFNLDNGQCVDSQVNPGRIDLDGYEYDAGPSRLHFSFRTAGGVIESPNANSPATLLQSFLTLAVGGNDLRQETVGPITTKAKFDIWNENEVRFSGTERCVTCWDLSGLQTYTAFGFPNHFLLTSLHTTMGRARVNGMASVVCDKNGVKSSDAPLLGVMHKVLRFPTPGIMNNEGDLEGFRVEKAGVAIGGQGDEVAQILYDVVEPPQEARDGNGG